MPCGREFHFPASESAGPLYALTQALDDFNAMAIKDGYDLRRLEAAPLRAAEEELVQTNSGPYYADTRY
jgi:hypothetical protein